MQGLGNNQKSQRMCEWGTLQARSAGMEFPFFTVGESMRRNARTQEKVLQKVASAPPPPCQAAASWGFRCSQFPMHGGWGGVLSRGEGLQPLLNAPHLAHKAPRAAFRQPGCRGMETSATNTFARNFPLCGFLCHSLDKRRGAEQM